MWDAPRQRPEHFRINPYCSLAEGAVFLGLGGGGCAKSLRYHDASGNGNHGTLTGMAPPTDWVWIPELGRFGISGFSSTAYINFTSPTLIDLPASGNFSVSFWRRDASSLYNACLLGWGGTDDLLIYGSSAATDMVRYFWRDASGSSAYLGGDFNSFWHHYALVSYGLTNTQIFMDGVSLATSTANRSGAGPFTSLHIGNWADDTTQDAAYSTISDLVLHNRALSAAEIQQLADPSNVMLSGLVLPPRRRLFAVTGAPPAFKPAWAQRRNRLIGAC